mmetsp:Transcript_40775/g.85654  ORF Transcript_40775/g.85654 Transcript_40775/m.85654 type:complete len:625 (+) Transcript_40775:52-1926(+)
MATDDPFACFGDDNSDSDIDSNNENEATTEQSTSKEFAFTDSSTAASSDLDRARHLVEAFNAKSKDNFAASLSTSAHDDATKQSTFQSSYQDQQLRTSKLPWPSHPPLYLGPMQLLNTLSEEGGGRGYVASQDLPPGTCVLIEEPFIKGWSAEQLGKRLGLESVQYLLEHAKNDSKYNNISGKGILECMEELHPRKQVVDTVMNPNAKTVNPLDNIQIADMISMLNSDASHVSQVEALISFAKKNNLTNSDGTSIESHDINRLLLTLRYNGFDSGLYLHFSMFNHSEDPNCIKFRPSENDNENGNDTNNDDKSKSKVSLHYSEARTTRHIRKGEALTLHYLENPREACHATRRKVLWDQHRFDIGGEDAYKQFLDANVTKTGQLFNDNERGNCVFESELVKGLFPPSTRESSGDIKSSNNSADGDEMETDDVPTTLRNIQKSMDDLEDMLIELRNVSKLGTKLEEDAKSAQFDRAAALELTINELITASKLSLNNDMHILLSRNRRLHLDAIELLLTNFASTLTKKQSSELLSRFIPSAKLLLQSQQQRLGKDHPDVARTYHDLSMGIRSLLSSSPKRLLQLKLEGMTTMEECSRVEHECAREKKRIEGLYPRDVDEILESVRR